MAGSRGDDETTSIDGTQKPALVDRPRVPEKHACLIVAFEGGRPFAAPSRHWLVDLDEVSLGRSKLSDGREPHRTEPIERTFVREGGKLRVRVPDPLVSAGHARLRRDGHAWIVEDREVASPGGKATNGTFVNGRPVKQARLADRDVIVLGRTAFVFREVALVEPPRRSVRDVSLTIDGAGDAATLSPALEALHAQLDRIVASDLPIVVLGEPGTGKELMARAIHRRSARKGAYVGVNCGAIPATVIESELFGHVKGAFSGADSHKDGLFAAADRGTLLLDEIGELPLDLQPKLLRALQEREVRPVGSTVARKVDVRVVAATNRPLPALVADGRFRADLWGRLNGFSITLPPLRLRKEDLGGVLATLLERHGAAKELTFTTSAVAALFAYDWPLNIRELEQAVRRAALLATPKPPRREPCAIDLPHLPDELHEAVSARGDVDTLIDERPPAPGDKERMLELLAKHRGKVAEVAKEWRRPDGHLGVSEEAIRKRCRKWGIEFGRYAAQPGDET